MDHVFNTIRLGIRYWEGRRLWSTLTTQTRNLSRFISVIVNTKGDARNEIERRGAFNLALALPLSIKVGIYQFELHNADVETNRACIMCL
jgi:predicted membrane chloride channel (bestrophin family)